MGAAEFEDKSLPLLFKKLKSVDHSLPPEKKSPKHWKIPDQPSGGYGGSLAASGAELTASGELPWLLSPAPEPHSVQLHAAGVIPSGDEFYCLSDWTIFHAFIVNQQKGSDSFSALF